MAATSQRERPATLAVRREDMERIDSLLSWLDARHLVPESEVVETHECAGIARRYTDPR